MDLEKTTQSFIDDIVNDLEYRGNAIFKTLVEDKDLYLNSIPESLFVNYFLPCMTGVMTRPNWITEWVSIAGTPSSEVRVIADITGELLYYVPPILNLNDVLLANRENNLANIFVRYGMMNNNLPGQGTSFLHNQLSEKQDELSVNNRHYLNVWYDIMVRYNMVPSNIQQSVVASNSGLNDFLDYE